ncbi:MAG: nucleoside triphosphate pyrophosphohydrolase [Dehalococcoidales bacterium]|nr:nucleoside triphosphate pyrophosphohydrolase [Dehalococcoidales bacterium]
MPEQDNLDRFETLVDTIARLRAPDGCPWDREQTHQSLREYLLEECYEALDALDEGDTDKLRDELGDILLQIMLHAQIGSEAGEFNIGDVIRNLNEKMIYRHPHVFGTTEVENAEEVTRNWQELKRKQKGDDYSLLESVPKQMPALSYAYEIQRRVAAVGFDWDELDGIIDKIAEEVAEFKESGDDGKVEEFGDLLFTVVNYARRVGIDSEIALREANTKFYKRFSTMEKLCRERGLDFAALDFSEQNALWNEAKKLNG